MPSGEISLLQTRLPWQPFPFSAAASDPRLPGEGEMPRGRDRLLKRRRPIQTTGQLQPSRAAASAPAGAFPPGTPAGPLPPPASGRQGHGGILHLPLLPRPDLLLIQRVKRSRGPDAGRGAAGAAQGWLCAACDIPAGMGRETILGRRCLRLSRGCCRWHGRTQTQPSCPAQGDRYVVASEFDPAAPPAKPRGP